jgi:hypothetical protein
LAAWDALDDEGRVRVHAVALCVVAFLLHFAAYSTWFIEDAAITFTYARNAAQGHGFVPYLGSEPVEGFSNPTWTLILTALRVVGVGPWVAAKLLGALFGAATVVLGYRWARLAMPEGRWALLVPLLLAASPQHVNWSASGLENGLFGLLLAGGATAMLGEVRRGGRPWSALWFAGLAATRPEGPLYVAAAGSVALLLSLRRGWGPGLRYAALWFAWLFAPLILWHAWRFWYFAWEFPNTYYAKLADADKFQPFNWSARGWRYLREWCLAHGRGFVLPLFVIGVTGLRGGRGIGGLVVSALLVLLALPGVDWPLALLGLDPWDEPELLVRARVTFLAAAALLVPAIGVDREHDAPRLVAWSVLVAVVFFTVYSGGDWMDGWRWLNLGIVPISVLLVAGLREVVGAISEARPRLRRAAVVVPVVGLIGADLVQAGLLVAMPVTTPFDVHRRVQYLLSTKDRLGLDHATAMDVDMGAHMWWYDAEIVDMAGLIDGPMGHHRWDLPFIGQYVYQERNPEFAHVHASWASKTKMRLHDEWDRYREIPAFPVSPWSQHPGNHVRRDLFAVPHPRGDRGRVRFGAVTLTDFAAPATVVAPGGALYVELGWQRTRREDGFRALLFLASGEATAVHELPPAYDWEPFRRWPKNDRMIGRHRVPIPADLPPGTYDLGLIAMGEGEEASIWPGIPQDVDWMTHQPRVALGEARLPLAVRVVSAAEAEAAGEVAIAEARALLQALDCEAGRERWRGGRHHVARDSRWRRRQDPLLADEIATCFATRAGGQDREGAVADLREARWWSPSNRAFHEVGAIWGAQLAAAGDAAWAEGDAERAYAAYRDALECDPSRTWTRRRAERARDAVLGIGAEEAE